MKGVKDPKKFTITILSVAVAILLLFVLYFAIFRPHYEQFVYEKQIEGANEGINYVVTQVLTNGYVQLQVGNETLTLIPYVPEDTAA